MWLFIGVCVLGVLVLVAFFLNVLYAFLQQFSHVRMMATLQLIVLII